MTNYLKAVELFYFFCLLSFLQQKEVRISCCVTSGLWTEFLSCFSQRWNSHLASGGAEPHLMYATYNFHRFIGRSINVKSAGLIGRHGPQSKQPFMVAFFKASEVLFRSVRAANNKRKNQNRNKSSSHQESSRMPNVGGKTKLLVSDLLVSLQ